MTMQLYAAKNYVLLKPLGETKSKSGIYVPVKQEKKPEMGIVFKIGAGTQPFPVKMKEGDRVMFKKYMSNEMELPSVAEKLNPVAFEDLTVLIREDTHE